MSQGNLLKRVYVAISGGVDSSVAAALLKKGGFDVTGVFFKPWSPRQNFWTDTKNTSEKRSKNLGGQAAYCSWREDRMDAMRVCAKLGIPFKTWDFSKEYGKKVAHYMINGYRAGITPNPDVMCNKEIKFGLFLKKALAEGADYIATGHYVRLSTNNESVRINEYTKGGQIRKFVNSNQTRYSLMAGIDGNKDQSYFLWTLTQEQLKYCLFPIGNYTKPEVRKLAKKFGLPNHAKKDSQGVCFIGQLDMKEFLEKYIKPRAGKIILEDAARSTHSVRSGRVVGQHDGAYYYTIGQRHGLDIKDGHGPYFVVGKDIKKNIIYVANQANSKQLTVSVAKIENINWVAGEPRLPLDCQVKIRYRSESIPAQILRAKSGRGSLISNERPASKLLVKFKKPVRALTPGQSAVFYQGQTVLGGGIIAE